MEDDVCSQTVSRSSSSTARSHARWSRFESLSADLRCVEQRASPQPPCIPLGTTAPHTQSALAQQVVICSQSRPSTSSLVSSRSRRSSILPVPHPDSHEHDNAQEWVNLECTEIASLSSAASVSANGSRRSSLSQVPQPEAGASLFEHREADLDTSASYRDNIDNLIKKLEDNHNDFTERCRAARRLGRLMHMGKQKVACVLCEQAVLEANDCWVRLAIAKALGNCPAEQDVAHAVAPVLAKLLRDDFIPVRRHAVQDLANFGSLAIDQQCELAHVAMEDEDLELRVQSVHALTALGPNVASTLVKIFRSDYWRVRCTAAEALAKLIDWKGEDASTEEIDFLIRQLGDLLEDKVPVVRETSAAALGDIGAPAIAKIFPLAVVLRDSYVHPRIAAAKALGKIVSDVLVQHPCAEFAPAVLGSKMPLTMVLDQICRALTFVLWDLSIIVRLEESIATLESKLRSECNTDEHDVPLHFPPELSASDVYQSLVNERNLFLYSLPEAVLDAFQGMGKHAVPSLAQRLGVCDMGHFVRMAVMRALHSTRALTLSICCTFISEWIGHCWEDSLWTTPERTLPLRDLKIVCFERQTVGAQLVVLSAEGGSLVYVAFGWKGEMLQISENFEPHEFHIKQEPGTEHGVVQIKILCAFWQAVDEVWNQTHSKLNELYGRVGIQNVVFCGANVGGALAQVAALRHVSSLCAEPNPTLHTDFLKSKPLLMVFGAPGVADMSGEYPLDRSWIGEKFDPASKCFVLERRKLVQKKPAATWRGLCTRRRLQLPHGIVVPVPRERYGTILPEELLAAPQHLQNQGDRELVHETQRYTAALLNGEFSIF